MLFWIQCFVCLRTGNSPELFSLVYVLAHIIHLFWGKGNCLMFLVVNVLTFFFIFFGFKEFTLTRVAVGYRYIMYPHPSISDETDEEHYMREPEAPRVKVNFDSNIRAARLFSQLS